MIKVLMICHGNICRSTMAEFVLKHLVQEQGLAEEFFIASAGTSREELGNDTHYGTRQKLSEEGIAFTKRKARQVTRADGRQFDYLLCMDRHNVQNLIRIIDKADRVKVHLLLDFCGQAVDIADPWYTGNFDTTYEDVTKGCRAFLEKVSFA